MEMNPGNSSLDIFEITQFETADELFAKFSLLSANICESIRQSKESHNFDLADRLIQYIRQNLTDYQFSVSRMAADMNLSPSYISRFFKDQTGTNIIQYLNNERINLACTLLQQKQLSIDTIAEMVGYGSTSGFIRMFKKIKGFTPGEFRKRAQG